MKRRTAAISVVSNSVLILLKVIAGSLTGSVAILTEAVHSSVDLIASLVAFVSVRIADVPADDQHRYGHHKVENLAAAFEAMLILVGSAAIAFEAIRRLIVGGSTHTLGVGIAVIAFSAAANVVVSSVIARGGRLANSPALQGDALHLRTDAASSFGVLIALVLVHLTGAQWIDPVAALVMSAVILSTGVRLLVRSSEVLADHALPAAETAAIERVIAGFADRGVVGFHELRTRQAGSNRYVDVHVQFRKGFSLEQAHWISHAMQDQIKSALGGADVLIHIEPEAVMRSGQQPLKSRPVGQPDPGGS